MELGIPVAICAVEELGTAALCSKEVLCPVVELDAVELLLPLDPSFLPCVELVNKTKTIFVFHSFTTGYQIDECSAGGKPRGNKEDVKLITKTINKL